jgi:hypothetical protein
LGKGGETDISEADVLDDGGVGVHPGHDLFEDLVDDAVDGGVFEAAFAGFGEGGADGEGYDYVVGVFGGAALVRILLFWGGEELGWRGLAFWRGHFWRGGGGG